VEQGVEQLARQHAGGRVGGERGIERGRERGHSDAEEAALGGGGAPFGEREDHGEENHDASGPRAHAVVIRPNRRGGDAYGTGKF
jgi:hypothetical protein